MTILFKAPPQQEVADVVSVSARPHGAVPLATGDHVFLWWSETQGGARLVGHGLCVSAGLASGLLNADVEIVTLRPEGVGFGKAQLAPHRDAPGPEAEATLARTLYRHAHDKAVALSATEEAFLDALFA